MAPKQYKSRIHLLIARNAPTVVILQRKRAKLFHVVTVDTKRRQVDEGSWFRGKLYVLRCDVSFDGKHMVYLAMGSQGNTWNGICRLPWLATLTEAENLGAWFGGGYFADKKILRTGAPSGCRDRWASAHQEQIEYDSARAEALRAAGYLVVRYTNDAIEQHIDFALSYKTD